MPSQRLSREQVGCCENTKEGHHFDGVACGHHCFLMTSRLGTARRQVLACTRRREGAYRLLKPFHFPRNCAYQQQDRHTDERQEPHSLRHGRLLLS